MMKTSVCATLFILLLTSCGNRLAEHEREEKAAQEQLYLARRDMAEKRYDQARLTIKQMRKEHPTALNVRVAAILTLDSVELLEAQDSLLIVSEKVKAEEARFAPLERQRSHRGSNREYFNQKNRLMKVRNECDEIGVKVKFYLRKLEEDHKAAARESDAPSSERPAAR